MYPYGFKIFYIFSGRSGGDEKAPLLNFLILKGGNIALNLKKTYNGSLMDLKYFTSSVEDPGGDEEAPLLNFPQKDIRKIYFICNSCIKLHYLGHKNVQKCFTLGGGGG